MLRTLFVLMLLGIGIYYSLRRGSVYTLYFYIWYAYFRPDQWVWTDAFQGLNISLVIGVFLVLATILDAPKPVVNLQVFFIALLGMHTFLSTMVAHNFEFSWTYWKAFGVTLVIVYLIIILITDLEKYRVLLLVMSLSLGILRAKEGWYNLIVRPGAENANSIPFLGDANGVAIGLLMLVPVFIVLMQTTLSKLTRYFYMILLLGVLYLAITSYSRGAFLGVIAMGAVYWVRSQQKVRSLILILVVLAVIIPTLPESYWNEMETVQTYEEVGDSSALGRLHFWSVAVEMAKANPYFGIGINGYTKAYDAYDTSEGLFGRRRAVHSSWFGVLAELGFMGAALYAAIVMGVFWSCYRVRRLTASNPGLADFAKYAIALETSLVAWMVAGSFHIFQYSEMVWYHFGLAIALQNLASLAMSKNMAVTPAQESSVLHAQVTGRRGLVP